MYVTAGTGHRRAAEAVAEALRQRDALINVECVDLLSYVPRWLTGAYPGTYEWLVRRASWLWAAGYYGMDHPAVFPLLQPWRRLWNRWMARRFIRHVVAHPPDVVVTTHFFPTDVLGHLRASGRLTRPLIVVVTDLFPHRFWLTADPSAILVGTEEVKRCCLERGALPERVQVTGIPVRPAFAQAPDRAAALQQLHLDPARRTVLITGGGMGVGPIESLLEQLLKLDASMTARMQLVVVCGQNDSLRRRLTTRCAGAGLPVKVEGFIETMPMYMRAADVLVTKPGGLTVVEALAMGLPMVLFGAIPGQEKFNALYAVSHGAAFWAKTVPQTVSQVRQLLDRPEELERLRRRALDIGRPAAAFDAADLVRSHAQHA